jgi:DNA transposition AAA+ family ATPase
MSMNGEGRRAGKFIITQEHRMFSEFADAVRRHRYIGLCYGPAGVGKTQSARHYANWDLAENLLTGWGHREASDQLIYSALSQSRTVFYTPTVSSSIQEVRKAVDLLTSRVTICIAQSSPEENEKYMSGKCRNSTEMLVIDETERLSNLALEHLRDVFDRTNIGLMLIGMPGIEKRLSRYPQLYSRVGFAHHYRPLRGAELAFVLQNHWRELGLNLSDTDFTDSQAVASIARITGGNFRLLQRLFVQIERILRINELNVISDDVVEAARSTLVIGAT